MSVYIDDMYKRERGHVKSARGRTMKLSHMYADTQAELYEMAKAIRCEPQWVQNEGQGIDKEHFDISLMHRARAIKLGAKLVTTRELVTWRKQARAKGIEHRVLRGAVLAYSRVQDVSRWGPDERLAATDGIRMAMVHAGLYPQFVKEMEKT